MSVDLRVDWCSYEAAKYAVEHWHYSKVLPGGKRVYFGVWEDEQFIGCVIYGLGANCEMGTPYGLKLFEAAELVRVALTKHQSLVSEIVAKTIKVIKSQSPGIRLIVSYADPAQSHVGSIYQAMNWIYSGVTESITVTKVSGKLVHRRTVFSRFGTNQVSKFGGERVTLPGKHKYLYPLDRAMRKQIAPLAKPYPKRDSCVQSIEGDTVGIQPTGEGSIPSDRSDRLTI